MDWTKREARLGFPPEAPKGYPRTGKGRDQGSVQYAAESD
jgi:hypothetical protein